MDELVGLGVGSGVFLTEKGILSGALYSRLFHNLIDKEELVLSSHLLFR